MAIIVMQNGIRVYKKLVYINAGELLGERLLSLSI